VFGRLHMPHGQGSHLTGRHVVTSILVAALLALVALLLVPPHAHGNFVYWSEASPSSSIGRAKINGTGLNTKFIPGLGNPTSVAVDSQFVYWSDRGTNVIGRANLDGSGVNPSFVTTGVNNPAALAVSATGIYWANNPGVAPFTIGHANIDGTNPVGNFITLSASTCGLAADSSSLYFIGTGNKIGRATLDGSAVDPSFISVPSPSSISCGLAVDPSFVYYPSDSGNTVGRAPVGGGTADASFIAAGTTGGGPSGVGVNSQYIFWGNYSNGAVGRANIDGSSPNPAFIPSAGVTGPGNGSQFVAAPSNKITVNSVTTKKKKGTAAINTKVPGPGQVTLDQNSTPPDVNATAAAVKQQGLTVTAASSFTLAVKPVGKTAKKLKKQVRKKGKGKIKQTVFIHFVPAGVAGVPNDQAVTVTLIKRGKRKK
jgi:low-density lipoprotein receptor class B